MSKPSTRSEYTSIKQIQFDAYLPLPSRKQCV